MKKRYNAKRRSHLKRQILDMLNQRRKLIGEIERLTTQRDQLKEDLDELQARKASLIHLQRVTDKGIQTIDALPEEEEYWRKKGFTVKI